MTRETLKSFLNRIGSDSDKISYKVDPSSGDPNDPNGRLERGISDLGIDPNTDIPLLDFESNKGFLGDYLSDITKNNDYNIKEGNVKFEAHKKGMSLNSEAGANNNYIQDSELVKSLNEYSNSNQFSNLNNLISKTEANNHDLLKEIKGGEKDTLGSTLYNNTDGNNTILKAVENVLKEKNRYYNTQDGVSFAGKSIQEEDFELGINNSGTHTIQNKLGKHEKELKYNIDSLKKIGLSMLYKASGYDKGSIPGESISVETIEANPGLKNEYVKNDTFNKVEFNKMRALNAADAPSDAVGYPYNSDPYLVEKSQGEYSNSYGHTYNDSVHFYGKNKDLLLAKSIIACKAVIQIGKNFLNQIKSSISQSEDDVVPGFSKISTSSATKGPFFLGSSRGYLNANLDLLTKSLIVKTKFEYSDCIDAGLELLFGKKQASGENSFDTMLFKQSPGHFLAICLSTIKEVQSISEQLLEGDIKDLNPYFSKFANNKIFKFLNVLATIGDRALSFSGGNKNINIANNARNVDKLSDLPGNRPGKFRKKNGRSLKQVSWNSNETPNAYLLPTNIIRASVKLDQGINSSNPIKGMLGSELALNTYMSVNNDGGGSRIPSEVVKEIEDNLDAEYVPFYIHDLRTNEIISFHAFLDSVSDSINPSFSGTPGYGRMDPVQIYSSTTRSVQCSFTLVATSKEDFNLMWYKINKLTTLAYPQWSQGTKVSNDSKNVYIQPFSQVIGASPLVRLRIGDLIKTNYSRFNLARIFGIGDPNIKAKPAQQSIGGTILGGIETTIDRFVGTSADGLFNGLQEAIVKTLVLAFGSPASYLNIGGAQNVLDNANLGGSFSFGAAAQENIINRLTNGFVNPLLEAAIVRIVKSPNVGINNLNQIVGNASSIVKAIAGEETGFKKPYMPDTYKASLLANTITGYRTSNNQTILLSRETKVQINEYIDDTSIMYKVTIDDPNSKYNGEQLYCEHTDLFADPEYLFWTSNIGQAFAAANGIESLLDSGANDIAQDNIQKFGFTPKVADLAKTLYKKDEVLFMEPENNPFVRAYESTKGRGLAGVLSNISFTWGVGEKFKWETDYNSRAPMGCKIGMTLNVIHDIPPGLDHSGFNRAPLYNVGDIMKTISGDPYEDNGSMSKFRYDTGREDKKIGED